MLAHNNAVRSKIIKIHFDNHNKKNKSNTKHRTFLKYIYIHIYMVMIHLHQSKPYLECTYMHNKYYLYNDTK